MNPTKIIFGKGEIKRLSKEIPSGKKILIIYGGGSIKTTGLLDVITEELKEYSTGEFGGIEPNPSYETLMKAVELIKREGYDYLLAAGGGSVIDGTKFIAAAVLYADDDPWKLVTDNRAVKKALPFGVILTLPASGSEMNGGAVITRKSIQTKLPFFGPAIFPVFSVLDPVYTYTLPEKQIANGVVDSFIHVMEQYLTFPVEAKVQDRFSEGLLHTLIEEGPKALQDCENYDVRANIMWAATMAYNGLIGCGVPQDWSTHMIGHEITVLYGLDHAETLAVVFLSMLEVMKDEKREKLLQYGERIWKIDTSLPEEDVITLAIDDTRSFFRKMGLRTCFSEHNIGSEVIDKVIESLKAHGMVMLGEKGKVVPDLVRKVLVLSL
jgi:NADP-dependent alcohol dehydrogenase